MCRATDNISLRGPLSYIAEAQRHFDPVTMDPPASSSARYPGRTEFVKIDSRGAEFNAFIRLAQGEGPHPTVIYLHGFPGGATTELPSMLQRAGFNVVYPHYRGMWGSGSGFSWKKGPEDEASILEFPRLKESRQKDQIDPDNFLIVKAWLMSEPFDPNLGCTACFG